LCEDFLSGGLLKVRLHHLSGSQIEWKSKGQIDMRGEIVYQVYGIHSMRTEDTFLDAFRTDLEARAYVEKLKTREMNGKNWANQYHDKGFVIREVIVDTDFEIPSLPKPRDKYVIKTVSKNTGTGEWPSAVVEVYRRVASQGLVKICTYERNYHLLQTFEPFRQGNRELALISRDYTRTAVLDLNSGDIIAEEPHRPSGGGFCPVGFYVPDWWDVNDGSIIPGSNYWSEDDEWPTGNFGFVWGCHWGDDSSWKVQYLDLSQVQQGIIDRQERFGYVELATYGFENPCLVPDMTMPEKSEPPSFIRLARENGVYRALFAVEMEFDLNSGKPKHWVQLTD